MSTAAPTQTLSDAEIKAALAKLELIKPEDVPDQTKEEAEFYQKFFAEGNEEFELDPNNGLQFGFLVSAALRLLWAIIPQEKLAQLVLSALPDDVSRKVRELIGGGSTAEVKTNIANLIKSTVENELLKFIPAGPVKLVLNIVVGIVVDLFFTIAL